MSLTVTDLSCARGGVPVLEGVSFTLEPGQALELRGPNGSGKTTLLRTLAGLQSALDGGIEAPDGAIAYAGHADGLKATLSVAENLRFWAAIYGGGAIDAALAAFDLRGLEERPAGNLSAGQKRRLGLARLLVTGRAIWMLDEPVVSLDTASVALFAAALKTHLAGGGSAVIATHVDLDIGAGTLDVSAFRAAPAQGGAFDEAFL
ncbi:MAG: heme ABC exporter ATP-binding protein CcmA [Alphaproteobacteria bacterium]|nr:heme ABC exporter ATP-binding protein CcmA [Alphaproteobacteria bacterium]NNF25213.1 heme ABC exporter ATP-binding protein CcmA [Paracoccaceae bacterium]